MSKTFDGFAWYNPDNNTTRPVRFSSLPGAVPPTKKF